MSYDAEAAARRCWVRLSKAIFPVHADEREQDPWDFIATDLQRAHAAGVAGERERVSEVLRALADRMELRASMAQERARGCTGDLLMVLDDEHISWATEAARVRAALTPPEKCDDHDADGCAACECAGCGRVACVCETETT